jgi:hypothetical protein
MVRLCSDFHAIGYWVLMSNGIRKTNESCLVRTKPDSWLEVLVESQCCWAFILWGFKMMPTILTNDFNKPIVIVHQNVPPKHSADTWGWSTAFQVVVKKKQHSISQRMSCWWGAYKSCQGGPYISDFCTAGLFNTSAARTGSPMTTTCRKSNTRKLGIAQSGVGDLREVVFHTLTGHWWFPQLVTHRFLQR